jgi:formylmethanofuran dehydrogenase subunit E
LTLSNEFLGRAVDFHGHLGPFLVLGLRAGLLGTHHLGKSHFELKAGVETSARPPRSCFIDGVQFSSGCTTGKGNLEVRTGSNVSVEFTGGGRSLRIGVKDHILEMLDSLSSEERQVERLSREMLQKTDDELFSVKTD